MSFLAPLFLLGAGAVALPIVLHLIRRSSRDRVPFSSLMFLMPTPPRVTRRSKLENILLLILRCLVLCLLAFAFARPFFSRPMTPDPAGQAGERILLLIDTSASMRRGDLWSQAKARAHQFLRSVSPADLVACVTFDRDVHQVVSFDEWLRLPIAERPAIASRRIDDLNPGWQATRLGSALTRACELFEAGTKNEQTRKRIVLFTDLQEGSRLDGLQGFEWPRGLEVSVEPLRSSRPTNAGLQLALDRNPFGQPVGDVPVRVRVSNASDSRREQFQVGWRRSGQGSSLGATMDVYVPPGQSRVITIPRPAGEPTADQIALSGDDESFDNSVFVVPARSSPAEVLVFGDAAETDATQSLYYLKRAFQETRSVTARVTPVAPGASLAPETLAQASLLIINDPLPDPRIAEIRRSLEEGKAALISLNKLPVVPTLAKLVGEADLAADEVGGPGYRMLGRIDFQHPLFAPFADPRYSDFTKIHFWKHRKVDFDQVKNALVVAQFDNGDPALVEVPVGQGRLWVLTTGWEPADSQLALSSKFVPLLYAMLEQAGGLNQLREQFTVGDEIPVGGERAEAVTVRKPGASEVKLGSGERFTASDEPGVYQVKVGNKTVQFAVNLAAEESRTAPMAVEDLVRLGVPLQRQAPLSREQVQKRREHLHAVQLESRQKVWRWLIVAALVVLVVETWLAGRATRRALVPVGSQ